ncbi:hypothetical protein BDP81DRAFT_416730 [Colletotrichum phormii]|uniref:Uncharacterized protein n=1 Tax=Colletotrichum phormii TaxID=359342 RepID=A0AAJ0A2H6_9PEZI|nr:uncharacterized protein BDP81DRAFT_416730 [Colletotrichum phormii]KAK1654884.1 hypothetical protein BDP81DRAFT_416730 [Colletotrichum phormii]
MARVKAEQPTGNNGPVNGRDQQQWGGRGRGRGRGGGQQGRMHRTIAPWSARDDYALRRRSPSPKRRSPAPQPWVSLGGLHDNLQKWMRNGERDKTLAEWGLGPGDYDILEDRVLADIAVKWPDVTVALLYDKAQEARDSVYRRLEGQGKVRISLEASDWLVLASLWTIMNKALSPVNRKYPFEHTYEQIRSFDTGAMDNQYAFYFKKCELLRAQDAPTAAAAPITRCQVSSVPVAGSYIMGEQAHMQPAWMAPPPPHPSTQGGFCTGNHGGSFVPMLQQGTWVMGGEMGQPITHGGTAGHFYPAPQHHPGAQPRSTMTYY